MVIRLPQDKLTWLRNLIGEWKGCKTCCKRQLLSLINQLQHAFKVMQPGCLFLRRMIDLSTVEAASPDTAQPWIPIQPSMVGPVPYKMELCIDDEKSPRWHSGSDSNVRCVRKVGQWCLYKQWRVVPASNG